MGPCALSDPSSRPHTVVGFCYVLYQLSKEGPPRPSASAPGVMSRKRHFSQNTWVAKFSVMLCSMYSLAFARTKINTPDPKIYLRTNSTQRMHPERTLVHIFALFNLSLNSMEMRLMLGCVHLNNRAPLCMQKETRRRSGGELASKKYDCT